MSDDQLDAEETPRDRLHGALSQIVRDDGPNMLTRWVCLLEIVNTDGERQVWDMHSRDLGMWEEIGMLEFQSRCLRPEPPPSSNG